MLAPFSSLPSAPPAPSPARTFCRRSRYLSKEPALVLNNTRVPSKLLCLLRHRRRLFRLCRCGQRGPLTVPPPPCPLWKITSTVFSPQIPWRRGWTERGEEAFPTLIDPTGKESARGAKFRKNCLVPVLALRGWVVLNLKDGG